MPTQFFLRNTSRKNPDNRYTEVDLDSFKITRPIVICFSGNATVNIAQANAFCKIAERQLRLLFDEKESSVSDKPFTMCDNIDIMGVVYEQKLYSKGHPVGYIEHPTRKQLVDNLFMPLCKDKDGKRASVNKVRKNLSLITFFSYCHGARETYNTMELLCGNLRDMRYTESEIRLILTSMLEVSFAPSLSEALVPRVDLISTKDSTCGFIGNNFKSKYKHPVEGIEFDYNKKVLTYRGELFTLDKVRVISSEMKNSSKNEMDEHDVSLINRGKDWESELVDMVGNKIYYGKNADAMSQISSYALSYAVSNGLANQKSKTYVAKMPLRKLAKDFESIKQSFSKEDLAPFDNGQAEEENELEKI